MAANTEAYWWRGIQWLDWIEEVGAVDRPTEDKCMRRLALQTVKAVEHLQQVRAFIFLDIVREVLVEERQKRDDWTLRQIHAAQGFRLEWVEQTTKRGNTYIEVVRVELPRAS